MSHDGLCVLGWGHMSWAAPCVLGWHHACWDGDMYATMGHVSSGGLHVLGQAHMSHDGLSVLRWDVSWDGTCVPGQAMCPRPGPVVQTGTEPVPGLVTPAQQAAFPSCRAPAAPAAPALPAARGAACCRGVLPPPQGWDRALGQA